MEQNKHSIAETFQQIGNSSLWDAHLPISFEEYEKLLSAESTEKLFRLIEQQDEGALQAIQLEELLKMPFARAEKSIDQLSLAKRIELLGDLDKRRTYLYSQASRYGAESHKGLDPLSAKDWRTIMGRIKHLEIIQAWLYGIQ